ncbi:envelope stress response membrane protein PspB [Vibrio sp. SS-MA-C1-2]|uniref:envelope stress response membrane protein PspB n=1 Tax=Vibrio sp. SS-MA-C1-2 TaxID=2908646 RepID=UPI001F460081|nr:envelope stress response membrane protein PspB [Vibrio sp. SS-MA-C1-2]UJF19984.1 envelope stress response membrane protein PspB [Vibrio sp. SS-MA-C1-2]
MSTGIMIALPLMVFFIFVAPLWLVLYYRSQNKMGKGLNNEDYEKLQSLTEKAEMMQQRVQSLEKILDAEVPDWRRK